MDLPDLRNFDLNGKRVLVRVDFDVPLTEEGEVADEKRIRDALPTIDYLLSVQAQIILLTHLGRPEGKVVPELDLNPVWQKLKEYLPDVNVKFLTSGLSLISREKIQIKEGEIVLLENLRFDPGEEGDDPDFAKKLAGLGDFYINEAFAASHRSHASIVGLPKLLPHAAGLELLKEVGTLSSVLEKPNRPVLVVLGGAKEDKLESVQGLSNFADQILLGGRLPMFVEKGDKLVVGELNESTKDITLETVQNFTEIIEKAGTIIWNGPMGQYEQEVWAGGTKIIAEAVANSGALKIVGGGDTEAVLAKFGLKEKIDFISSGGGAMLEFLASGDLPGLKALRND